MPAADGSDDLAGAERQYRVHLCFGPNCTERGSKTLLPVLEQAVREAGLTGSVEILATTCRDRCDYGPSLNVYPGPVFYNQLDASAIRDIVDDHLARGTIVDRLLFRPKIERLRRG
ncbi:MAG: (2Fe-2S) ferredoxin domain-containing protein [Chloroflexia bacterium]|nr:(2Fe-2S) ferredoxin domain-containing protein [Chloroflexia bacterium]